MNGEHKITVKGIGKLKLAVDWIKISFSLTSCDTDYSTGYEAFAKRIAKLQDAVASVGFKKDDLKASSIKVTTSYKDVKCKNNGVTEYKTVFDGYKFDTDLNISLPFDSKKLGNVLKEVALSEADPKFYINFSVKDEETAKNSLLAAAAQNAKTKAEILCKAVGAKLGKLSSISYNWDEIDIYSNTSYAMERRCLCAGAAPDMDFTPEDVELEDSATFVWDIV